MNLTAAGSMTDVWQVINIACLVMWVGLAFDRYFLMQQRWIEDMTERTIKEGRCIICKRPMKVVRDERFFKQEEL